MQTIQIRTTQNVIIQYPLASVGDRIIAHLLDGFFLVLYSIAMMLALVGMEVEIWWIYLVLIGFPILFYSLFFEILMDGQTPGKRLMKIKVIRLDGTEPTIGAYILRWLFRIVDFHLMTQAVAIIAIAAGGKGQRVGDMVAGTSVIKIVATKEITAEEVFITTEDTYRPTFQNAVELSSRDIEIMQQALSVGRNGNTEPAEKVAEKIKSILNIQSNLSAMQLLETVIKDFHHLTSRA